MNRKHIKYLYLSLLTFILIVIDQLSKYLVVDKLNLEKNYSIVKHIFSLEYLENRGVAFGIMSGKMTLITLVVIIVTLFIIYIIYLLDSAIIKNNLLSRKFTFLQILCCLLIAGAVGNLIDRLRLKYVIDFIKFDFIDFPTFNIADCYVTIGAALLFITLMFFVSEDEFNLIKK